jgi:hypothetical protein
VIKGINVPAGKFRMSTPFRSVQGNFIIVGALVGGVGIYSKRVKPDATRDDLRRAYGLLREQIHKDHPGIKEEFTMLRPRTAYN